MPAVATDDQPGSLVFLAVRKKFDIVTQNLQVPAAMQKKKKKTLVNSSQSNYTTENCVHIANIIIIIIILNNGYPNLKIYVMY